MFVLKNYMSEFHPLKAVARGSETQFKKKRQMNTIVLIENNQEFKIRFAV